jgi:prepilin-type N-terminal cleavage/methylation domain-containing protein
VRVRRSSVLRSPYAGTTLLELLLALAVVSILAGIAVPRGRALVDRIAARGAAGDAAEVLESARQLALSRWARATVTIDTAAGVLVLVVGPDTILRRDERRGAGVVLRASRLSATYTPMGMALGVSNLTVVAARGAAAETVTVSRLGRVRW